MQKISILGCGWLGLPLGESLVKKGHLVKGSTTSREKLPLLEASGIIPFEIMLHEDRIRGDFEGFMQNTEILIVDIPPKRNSPENFTSKIKSLLLAVEKSSVKKILFVSSTSVYAHQTAIITEETKPNPETENAKQLLEAEQLLKNFPTPSTIVRFGGLIGSDRHPVRFLAGKKNLENPNGSINFIHQLDCIGILQAIIEKDCWNQTFNAVAPQHPTREEYYTLKAKEFNLPFPEFDYSQPSAGKIISSEKLQTVLGYRFEIAIA